MIRDKRQALNGLQEKSNKRLAELDAYKKKREQVC